MLGFAWLQTVANYFQPLKWALCFQGGLVIDLIMEELINVRDELKSKTKSELKLLCSNALTKDYVVFGQKIPLTAWSEEEKDNSIVVVIQMRKKCFLSELCYQQGFRYHNGVCVNLTEEQLWAYD